ncbi:hypothetical protein Esi_1076_0001 [Ectocarpus siliculosus]|uniref:Uncharacterized protein n=1 Tax=Ectocarpus siliculosus TaxID=2880 RepID=D7FHE8_ECTSI|nr:hypothetical protein Esi_1076_0001 [Ectocarpus siliculosus]|eukprot:CBJ34130.1 hypothetical protein Esi_1076_0001 [Ectocarpus siliculosus]
MTKETSAEVVVDGSLEYEERAKFLQFGLCGRCDRVFRISQGWKHVEQKSRHETVVDGESKLRHLSTLVAKAEMNKTALRAARGAHKDILEATEKLRALRHEVSATRRALAPLVMSCPFCLWNSAPLFSSPCTGGGG